MNFEVTFDKEKLDQIKQKIMRKQLLKVAHIHI